MTTVYSDVWKGVWMYVITIWFVHSGVKGLPCPVVFSTLRRELKISTDPRNVVRAFFFIFSTKDPSNCCYRIGLLIRTIQLYLFLQWKYYWSHFLSYFSWVPAVSIMCIHHMRKYYRYKTIFYQKSDNRREIIYYSKTSNNRELWFTLTL